MPVSITPIFIFSPRKFVGAAHTVGAPMYGTLVTLSGTSSCTGSKAFTPGSVLSVLSLDAGICTLMPFSADWNWARTFPPADSICAFKPSCAVLS